MKYLDLKDKYVVITGTNSGIGRGLCKAFLENDCKVIAVYREEKPDFLEQSHLSFLKADIRETEIFSPQIKRCIGQTKTIWTGIEKRRFAHEKIADGKAAFPVL